MSKYKFVKRKHYKSVSFKTKKGEKAYRAMERVFSADIQASYLEEKANRILRYSMTNATTGLSYAEYNDYKELIEEFYQIEMEYRSLNGED